MKKFALIAASALTAFAGFAQTENAAPNRILVTNTVGSYTGYVIDYTDNISFARVDGEVLAKVEINEIGLEEMRLTVTKTDECNYYKLAVLPQNTSNQLKNDVSTINYIHSLPSDMVPTLWEDFDNGLLTGISLKPNSDYSIITIGVDKYGVEAGVCRADFSTPAPEIVGNPHVEAVQTGSTLTSFTMAFTPNDDVQSYWTVAGEIGVLEKQYEMFGPMMGFANFSDMIRSWGIEKQGPMENTWKDMAPNTEYEVFVAMTDANGNFAPYERYTATTEALGGTGAASVDIEIGDYFLDLWGEDLKPTLQIIFTPNEEASCYRMGVYTAAQYEENTQGILEYLCSDPEMPTVNWFFYDAAIGEYQVDTASDIVIVAAAKNGNGEWGEVNTFRYTTPADCEGYVSPAAAPARKEFMPRAKKSDSSSFSKGTVPAFAPRSTKLQLR